MGEIMTAIKGFWPLLLLLAFFYFALVRPQKKQQNKRTAFLNALQKGDYVITAGGVYGLVKKITGNVVSVQIAPGTIIQVDKRALQAPPEDEGDKKSSEKSRPAHKEENSAKEDTEEDAKD